MSETENETTEETTTEEYDIKVRALAAHLDCDPSDIFEERQENVYSYGRQEYLVCTDEEADQAWDEALDNYLDECVLCDLPEVARNYFDSEKWKRDARHDGRGHSLSSYDGNENEEKIDGEWIFIYRQN